MADFNNQFNVNSNGLVFFDENSRMLRCSFLNDSLSLTIINPATDSTGKKVYRGAPSDSVVLTKDRVSAMYEIIVRKVLGAIESKTNYNGGVFTSNRKDTVFEIRVDNGNIYAILHKDIDAGRVPKYSVEFQFTKTPIIEKFKSGNSDFEIEDVHANFALFVKMLEGFMLVNVSGNTAHGYRNQEKYTNDIVLRMLNDMANKLGVQGSVSTHGTAPNANAMQDTNNYQEASSLDSLLRQ